MTKADDFCCDWFFKDCNEQSDDAFYFVFTVKPVLSRHSKRTPKIGFQYRVSLNAGQKYCRILQGEHSAMLSTFIKQPFAIKIVDLSTFEWPLKTGFTVL